MGNEHNYKNLLLIASMVAIASLIAYNLYTGNSIKKVGIPSVFEIEFGQKQGEGGASKEQPHSETQGDLGRIKELQERLEQNAKNQLRARREIERLEPMVETDRDAPAAIETQERWLKDLAMEREELEAEIDRLRRTR
jgi:hypothetical protein